VIDNLEFRPGLWMLIDDRDCQALCAEGRPLSCGGDSVVGFSL